MTADDAHQKNHEGSTRLDAIVHGRVQGVGFRASTQDVGRRLGLVGWVCNRFDGTVQVAAEGPQPQLLEFLEFLRTGPRMAHVTRVDAQWNTARGEDVSFELRGTR